MHTDSAHPLRVVVMGVSASGKSSVGRGAAGRLGVPFVDADDLHPLASVEKMRAGTPLDDTDRGPWLDAVGHAMRDADGGVVMACSALKRAYRDRIRAVVPDAYFVMLHGSDALLASRAASRVDHFMPPSLLASQLATLEPLAADERGVVLDVAAPVAHLVEDVVEAVRSAEVWGVR